MTLYAGDDGLRFEVNLEYPPKTSGSSFTGLAELALLFSIPTGASLKRVLLIAVVSFVSGSIKLLLRIELSDHARPIFINQ